MEKFDAQIKCKINRLKELVVRTYTLALATLGALREESIRHGGSVVTKNQTRPLVRKGRLIECYLCSQNHFMVKFPMQGKLALMVEEEDRITPIAEESKLIGRDGSREKTD
jgi:hypothetical protein